MTERPQNLRPSRATERTGNSRRHQAESRTEEAGRAYRGSHRAERMHRADETPHTSRVGRHHAAQHEARW